jgi:hypothetical protein
MTLIRLADMADVGRMDKNLTSQADFRIPGRAILSRFKSSRNSRQNFSKFHTDSTQTARRMHETVQGRAKQPMQKSP